MRPSWPLFALVCVAGAWQLQQWFACREDRPLVTVWHYIIQPLNLTHKSFGVTVSTRQTFNNSHLCLCVVCLSMLSCVLPACHMTYSKSSNFHMGKSTSHFTASGVGHTLENDFHNVMIIMTVLTVWAIKCLNFNIQSFFLAKANINCMLP